MEPIELVPGRGRYAIRCKRSAEIWIDDRREGLVQPGVAGFFDTEFEGRHRIEARSDGYVIWRRDVEIKLGTMVNVDIPWLDGIDGEIRIDSRVVLGTRKLLGLEWQASSMMIPGLGHYAPAPNGEHLHTFQHANSYCPAGWRLPTVGDFESLARHFDDPIPDIDRALRLGRPGIHANGGGNFGDVECWVWLADQGTHPSLQRVYRHPRREFGELTNNLRHFATVRYVRDYRD